MKYKVIPITLLVVLGMPCSFVGVQGIFGLGRSNKSAAQIGVEKAAKKKEKESKQKLKEDNKKKEEERKKIQKAADDKQAFELKQTEKLYDEAIAKFFLVNFEKIRDMTSGNLYRSGVFKKSGFVRKCQEVIDILKKITPQNVIKEGNNVMSKIDHIEDEVKKYMPPALMSGNKSLENIVKSAKPKDVINRDEYKYSPIVRVTDTTITTEIKNAEERFHSVAGTHLLAICNTIYNLRILAKQIIKINEKILDKQGEIMAMDQQIQAIQTGV